jgi:hypothetical protein
MLEGSAVAEHVVFSSSITHAGAPSLFFAADIARGIDDN